jgi:glutathione S-transferase
VSEALALYMEAFWRNPWDCTVYVGLREKGLQFHTSIAMMSRNVGAFDALRARTFTGSAPVLQHGTFWIAESLAIVEYLEDAFPPPHWPRLFPADLRERARARQLLSWIRTSTDALRRERTSELMFYPSKTPLAPLSAAAQRTADQLLRVCEQVGAGPSGCLFGDSFGVVDVDLAFTLMRLISSGAAVPEPVAAYAAAVWARPSVREFVEHPRPPHQPADT